MAKFANGAINHAESLRLQPRELTRPEVVDDLNKLIAARGGDRGLASNMVGYASSSIGLVLTDKNVIGDGLLDALYGPGAANRLDIDAIKEAYRLRGDAPLAAPPSAPAMRAPLPPPRDEAAAAPPAAQPPAPQADTVTAPPPAIAARAATVAVTVEDVARPAPPAVAPDLPEEITEMPSENSALLLKAAAEEITPAAPPPAPPAAPEPGDGVLVLHVQDLNAQRERLARVAKAAADDLAEFDRVVQLILALAA